MYVLYNIHRNSILGYLHISLTPPRFSPIEPLLPSAYPVSPCVVRRASCVEPLLMQALSNFALPAFPSRLIEPFLNLISCIIEPLLMQSFCRFLNRQSRSVQLNLPSSSFVHYLEILETLAHASLSIYR